MKSASSEKSLSILPDLRQDYLNYYEKVCLDGNLKLCTETEVTEKAKRFLFSETNPGERFEVFDFYWAVSECLRVRQNQCRDVFEGLIKATEVLEMFCVNLFLFPWKKEIRSLKTFTGPFVYIIQPVLPPDTVRSVLETIGYYLETDTEYRLSKNIDFTKVKKVGFELFLARQECEYLLEVMGQKEEAECLLIIKQRFPALRGHKEIAEALVGEDFIEEKLENDSSLLGPGRAMREESQMEFEPGQRLEEEPLNAEIRISEEAETPDLGPSRSILSEDSSISEMRANYPDLTFRQKRIFSYTQEHSAAQRNNLGDKRMPEIHDLSGPQSIAMFTVSALPNELQAAHPPAAMHNTGHIESKQVLEEQSATTDNILSEITMKFNNLGFKDSLPEESLKYPIEETSQMGGICHDLGKHKPPYLPEVKKQPVVCHPSAVLVSNIPDCNCRSFSDDNLTPNAIKEPPQSFYIPPRSIDNQIPIEELNAESISCPNSCNETCQPPSKKDTLATEDDLLKGYVLV
uniref:Si:ch211-189a15.5 n=1 Tax=Lepisosteus oculatus TaxID=7918 RepID=W5MCV1_LEPOC